ncbi:MAG: NAD(P)-dependent oxidoreductase [Paracoccaceae bacterium]|uniref:NAD(P)-dependent oxidoreductase n=1 Tax=Salipiger profundus TaxID=1229727 RepID=UPI000B874444|nr:NAD(P)-dependent oxidoreductase [Salipiger profundus]
MAGRATAQPLRDPRRDPWEAAWGGPSRRPWRRWASTSPWPCAPPPADPLPGGTLRTGDGSLGAATQGADYVINVLPITAQIRDVLNRELLERMRRGGGLIQMGRGEHLVEEDLMALIDEGHLAGASFDVLRQEPLPADHPYWQHPKLRITPHVASGATPHAVAAQLVQSVQELRDGQPLSFEVDPGTGY